MDPVYNRAMQAFPTAPKIGSSNYDISQDIYRRNRLADELQLDQLSAPRRQAELADYSAKSGLDFQDYSKRSSLESSLGMREKQAQYAHDMEMQKLKSNPMMDFLQTYRMQQSQPAVGNLSELLNQYKNILGNQGSQDGMQRNWQTIASILGR